MEAPASGGFGRIRQIIRLFGSHAEHVPTTNTKTLFQEKKVMRVLMMMDPTEELRESAFAASRKQSGAIAKRPEKLSSRIELDSEFAAVPISRMGATAMAATADPEHATKFVVRGNMDADQLSEIDDEQGVGLFADPMISNYDGGYCARAPVGSSQDVARNLQVQRLQERGLDGAGVGVVICDTGINIEHLREKGLDPRFDDSLTWIPPGVGGSPGSFSVDHGTMCAYDALIAAPQATLLDFPILLSQTPGGSAMDGFLSDALQAFSTLATYMRQPEADRAYKSLIINNSWGMYHPSWDFPAGHPGRYADNPGHPFNLVVGTLARTGADIFFAAGNCGPDCPADRCEGVIRQSITGANAHPEVTTVAGVTTNRQWIGYSSVGPAIDGMADRKPDIACYSHFLGSEAFGRGVADTGTSTACPVAAGVTAAFRTVLDQSVLSPRDLARELRRDAKVPGSRYGNRWNEKFGYGVINPAQTAQRLLP